MASVVRMDGYLVLMLSQWRLSHLVGTPVCQPPSSLTLISCYNVGNTRLLTILLMMLNSLPALRLCSGLPSLGNCFFAALLSCLLCYCFVMLLVSVWEMLCSPPLSASYWRPSGKWGREREGGRQAEHNRGATPVPSQSAPAGRHRDRGCKTELHSSLHFSCPMSHSQSSGLLQCLTSQVQTHLHQNLQSNILL